MLRGTYAAWKQYTTLFPHLTVPVCSVAELLSVYAVDAAKIAVHNPPGWEIWGGGGHKRFSAILLLPRKTLYPLLCSWQAHYRQAGRS